ncbi:MAG: HEAT repeat domain-containing protein [Gemmatimonadetes bacterium]|nr:HEAT repeat domain-containing protein [Gemmatimonadota bacterium]
MTDLTDREIEIDRALVGRVMNLMAKCHRAIILYLPNNPVYHEAVRNVQAGFRELWEELDQLILRVREGGLEWEGDLILDEEAKGDSISWVLFKDGVRGVVLTPGVEDDELVRFLNSIHRTRNLPEDADDDLLTLLWEQDFQHIRYDHAEMGLDGVRSMQRSEQFESAPPPAGIQQNVEEEAKTPEGIVNLDDYDSTLHFLDDDEIQYLNSEIEREYTHDLRRIVLSGLLDVLEVQHDQTSFDEIITILEDFIPYLLGAGDFQSVAYILRESREAILRSEMLGPQHRERLAAFPAKLSEPDALDQLLQTLDEAHVHPTEEDLGELFQQFTPAAMDTVLRWLPRLTNERAKALIAQATDDLAVAHSEAVSQALASDNRAVLLGALGLVTRLKLTTHGGVLGKLTSHKDIHVRQALVDALATVGTPSAYMQLEQLLDDGDRDVRIGTVKVLGAKRHGSALPRIERALTGKAFRTADLTEKRAFYEAFGLVAGENGVAHLTSVLFGKGLLKRKVDPETRACAAMALGKTGSRKARDVLEKLTKEKEAIVRNATEKALKELG